MVYETIYTSQDKEDDINAGVFSTALLFGCYTHYIVSAFGTAFICGLSLSGWLNGHGLAYFGITVGGAAIHMLWQLYALNLDDPHSCLGKYHSYSMLT